MWKILIDHTFFPYMSQVNAWKWRNMSSVKAATSMLAALEGGKVLCSTSQLALDITQGDGAI